MLKFPILIATSVLISLLSWASGAQAQDELALSFALPPTSKDVLLAPELLAEQSSELSAKQSSGRSSGQSSEQGPKAIEPRKETALEVTAPTVLEASSPSSNPLSGLLLEPSVEPLIEPLPPITVSEPASQQALHAGSSSDPARTLAKTASATAQSAPSTDDAAGDHAGHNDTQSNETDLKNSSKAIGLSFSKHPLDLPKPAPAKTALRDTALAKLPWGEAFPTPPTDAQQIDQAVISGDNLSTVANEFELADWIFMGGANSLVARTVGSAEGTRQWDGRRTAAYYGHVDPGNGVWNLGTFSYQHDAQNPEEADKKQLKRLQEQASILEAKAADLGIKLSLTAKLNGLDLANQAPLAALDRGGYVERLAEAYRLNMAGEEAILFARTKAYLDPDTQTWNAPGLGNNIYSISRDQERRMTAIEKALVAFEDSRADRSLAALQPITLEDSALDDSNPPHWLSHENQTPRLDKKSPVGVFFELDQPAAAPASDAIAAANAPRQSSGQAFPAPSATEAALGNLETDHFETALPTTASEVGGGVEPSPAAKDPVALAFAAAGEPLASSTSGLSAAIEQRDEAEITASISPTPADSDGAMTPPFETHQINLEAAEADVHPPLENNPQATENTFAPDSLTLESATPVPVSHNSSEVLSQPVTPEAESAKREDNPHTPLFPTSANPAITEKLPPSPQAFASPAAAHKSKLKQNVTPPLRPPARSFE